MRCPGCGSHTCEYIVNRTGAIKEKKHSVRERKNLARKKRSLKFAGPRSKKNIESRTDFRAKCKRCGWEGEVK